MAEQRPSVEALVLAAGRGERLGLGPKALLVLGGRTLLERAIEVAQSVAERVLVAVPEECVEDVRACVPERVVVHAGGQTRMETFLRLFRASSAPLLLQHDVVHPFATPDLARRVVSAAERVGAAMAAARVAEHVFRGEGRVAERIAGGGALWLARKPLAFHRRALAHALDGRAMMASDAGTVELLLAAGQSVEPVAVEGWDLKVTTAADWALAVALADVVPIASGGGWHEGGRR